MIYDGIQTIHYWIFSLRTHGTLKWKFQYQSCTCVILFFGFFVLRILWFWRPSIRIARNFDQSFIFEHSRLRTAEDFSWSGSWIGGHIFMKENQSLIFAPSLFKNHFQPHSGQMVTFRDWERKQNCTCCFCVRKNDDIKEPQVANFSYLPEWFEGNISDNILQSSIFLWTLWRVKHLKIVSSANRNIFNFHFSINNNFWQKTSLRNSSVLLLKAEKKETIMFEDTCEVHKEKFFQT